MLSGAGCDERSIHSLMMLAQLNEQGRVEAIALVKGIICDQKAQRPSNFLSGCCYHTMNKLTDAARAQHHW